MSLVVSGSQEDGVVSVPSEGSVSPGVGSIVNMVRSGMGGGGGGTIGGGATGGQGAVIPGVSELGILWAVNVLRDLSGLSGEAGVLDHREAGERGHVHAVGRGEVNHQVPGHGGGRGDGGSECNKNLEIRKCEAYGEIVTHHLIAFHS